MTDATPTQSLKHPHSPRARIQAEGDAVFKEVGLTPLQLQQRDELLAALEKAEQQLDYVQIDAAQRIVSAAIVAAKGR